MSPRSAPSSGVFWSGVAPFRLSSKRFEGSARYPVSPCGSTADEYAVPLHEPLPKNWSAARLPVAAAELRYEDRATTDLHHRESFGGFVFTVQSAAPTSSSVPPV